MDEIFEAKPWLQRETFYIKGAETQGCPALTLVLCQLRTEFLIVVRWR